MGTTTKTRQEFKQVIFDFTRPADTTAYASGDVIANSTSAATVMTFPNCAEPGKGGCIRSVLLMDGAAQATKLNADLFLFSVTPVSYGNDNGAFVPTDAEMKNLIGVVSLDGTTAANLKVGDATVGDGGNVLIQQTGLAVPFQCAPGSASAGADSNLYGVLIARNAYTPVSAETFRVQLGIQVG